jgi:putative ATP-binding cassette transporter
VASFRQALTTIGEPEGLESRIEYAEGEPGQIRIDDLKIISSANADRLAETKVVVKSGERVSILGAPGTGKTQLFRALAGLWPWGAGEVTRPRGEQIFYLPRGVPYLPRGTLRELLAYPLKAESFDTTAFRRALSRFGLDRLSPFLDENRRWDWELSLDEQQCLAFARILLQAPPWVLMDGAFGALENDVLQLVVDVFSHELKATGLIHIGGAGDAHGLFSSELHLVKTEREPRSPQDPGSRP